MSKRGNGEGTIYFSDKLNRWVGQCYINNKRKTFYGKTRKEVKEKLDKINADLLYGNYVDKNTVVFNNLCKQIIEDRYNANLISDATYTRNIYNYKIIASSDLGKMIIQDIQPRDVTLFLNSITNYSNSVIKKVYQLLNKTFIRAISRGYIVKNPMDFEEVVRPKSNKPTKEVVALSVDEEKTLIKALQEDNSEYKNIILLMLFTGVRVGEALSITVSDIDFKKKTLKICNTITRDENDVYVLGTTTKTKKSRVISFNGIVEEILKDSITNVTNNQNSLIFYDDKGIITPSEVNNYLRRLNTRYNIAKELHNHMLRHTYATRCIESGMSIKTISKKLGHRDISTTLDIYTSILEQFELSEDEKLDEYLFAKKILLH